MEPQRTAARLNIQRFESGHLSPKQDLLAVEEPLEIRLGDESLTVTMRTPGNDFELAAGFLFTEGIVREPRDIESITYCVDEHQEYNVLTVELRPWVTFDLSRHTHSFSAGAACGLCGKTSIEAVRVRLPPVAGEIRVSASLVATLPARVRQKQAGFQRTGGLHAAWLCAPDGRLLSVREDVGRHNAVDKLIGEQLMAGKVPLSEQLMVLSGRAGFELVQKAAVAGVPMVVAIGAPSSLAVDLAQEVGMTLVGFARGDSFNVYTSPERITPASP